MITINTRNGKNTSGYTHIKTLVRGDVYTEIYRQDATGDLYSFFWIMWAESNTYDGEHRLTKYTGTVDAE